MTEKQQLPPPPVPHSYYPPEDELNLFELFAVLWKRRWWVMAVWAVVIAITFIWLMLVTPSYKASVRLLPPDTLDIAELQLKVVVQRSYSTGGVFARFLQALQSYQVKQPFFDKSVLPVLRKNYPDKEPQALFDYFDEEILSVDIPKKQDKGQTINVVMRYQDADQAAVWANAYVKDVMATVASRLRTEIMATLEVTAKQTQQQIDIKRWVSQRLYQDQVRKLSDAIVIAKKAGLFSPIENLAEGLDLPLYMRGANPLMAELEMLEKRENQDPYIGSLRQLQGQLAYLQGVSINAKNIRVASLDRSAMAPTAPEKPKRTIIVLLGVLGGLMLGVLIGFLVNAIQNWRLDEKGDVVLQAPTRD